MAGNESLGAAKSAKFDEFYTRYNDIEAEINAYVEYDPDVFRGKTILLPCDDPEWSNFTRYFSANFQRFGLKKLISTSYAPAAAKRAPSELEKSSPLFDPIGRTTKGKLFTKSQADFDAETPDIELTAYLEQDGDFRSEEVKQLRDEADIIVTNPPFSLFHNFMDWIAEGGKHFIVIGNMNAIKYREVFPLLKQGKIWLGTTYPKEFIQPDGVSKKFGNVCWFSNIDHGDRHRPLILDTMAHNLKFNKKLRNRLSQLGAEEYPCYGNYDAIEVPYVECIPSDYDGVMGVPISFLSKHNPEQFDLLGMSGLIEWATSDDCDFFSPPQDDVAKQCRAANRTWRAQKLYLNDENGYPTVPVYDRLFIKKRSQL